MSAENKENTSFTPYIPEYLHSVKAFYFIDKIKKYMNAEKRYPEDIYNFVRDLFSADIFNTNIFKKHPIDHKICRRDSRIFHCLELINDNINWIVFIKYNVIICMNDAMLSYIYPLREILNKSSSFKTTENIIRLPFIGIDETEYIGPRLFITESPLAMFEYFPSDFEPSHYNYFKKGPLPYKTIKYKVESNSENKTLRNTHEQDNNDYDYKIVNNKSKSPFRDNNLLESLNYYYKAN